MQPGRFHKNGAVRTYALSKRDRSGAQRILKNRPFIQMQIARRIDGKSIREVSQPTVVYLSGLEPRRLSLFWQCVRFYNSDVTMCHSCLTTVAL